MSRVSPSEDAQRPRWEIATVIVTGCAGLFVFHRATLLSGFDIVQADVGDSRLVVFLLEHWHRVWALDTGWASRAPPGSTSRRTLTSGQSDTDASPF